MNDPPPSSPSPERRPQHGFPVVLDIAGWPCLVVGAGGVAAHRTRGLLAAGARVTVVAPEVTEAFDDLAAAAPRRGAGPSLAIERRPYRPGEATGYRLVVTATGRPDVDGAVVADAGAGGVLVNSAHRATGGSLRFPAVHRAGPVTLAVDSSGTSPALARWLRTRVAGCLPPDVATIAALVEEARAARQEAGLPTRSSDWAALLDRVAPMVEAGRIAEARAALRAARPPPEPG